MSITTALHVPTMPNQNGGYRLLFAFENSRLYLGVEHCGDLADAGVFQDAVDAVRRAEVRCINDGGLTQQQVHELSLIAAGLSEWCTERSNGPEHPSGTMLTPRQYEIATLAALGCTNAEIANELGISINTVKTRLKQTFERLFVANRTELANVLPKTK